MTTPKKLTFSQQLGTNLSTDYTGGLMGSMNLPTAGNYTKYGMPVDSNVQMSPDTGSVTSSKLLEAMQLSLSAIFSGAQNQLMQGENSQISQLAKELKLRKV